MDERRRRRAGALVLATLAGAALAGCIGVDEDLEPGAYADGTLTPDGRVPFDVRLEHDFTTAAATERFDVPAGVRSVDLTIAFQPHPDTGACASSDAAITFTAPSGASATYRATGLSLGDPDCGGGLVREGATPEAGRYTVEFAGSGLVVGVVSMVERP